MTHRMFEKRPGANEISNDVDDSDTFLLRTGAVVLILLFQADYYLNGQRTVIERLSSWSTSS